MTWMMDISWFAVWEGIKGKGNIFGKRIINVRFYKRISG
jgi:hypothetical protein